MIRWSEFTKVSLKFLTYMQIRKKGNFTFKKKRRRKIGRGRIVSGISGSLYTLPWAVYDLLSGQAVEMFPHYDHYTRGGSWRQAIGLASALSVYISSVMVTIARVVSGNRPWAAQVWSTVWSLNSQWLTDCVTGQQGPVTSNTDIALVWLYRSRSNGTCCTTICDL